MRLNPYLTFSGQCEDAFRFYEKCLGGKLVLKMTYSESPFAAQTAPEWRKKVFHSTFEVGDYILQGADALPGTYEKPQGFSVMLNISDAAEANRVFAALAERASVRIPLQETPWASRFGALIDQFGTPWTINCGKSAS
jgi:PhnB protein